MKTVAFLAVVLLLTYGTPGYGNPANRQVTLTLTDEPLTNALDQIQKVSGIRLAYSQELVADAKRVTLKAEDEPVDEVLRRILRPRGLEFIYTGENVAAIVPADSDVGMAKAAGRAIRTLARLARKIESAEQEGDEIIMPEWTDEDDRALAEALADLCRMRNWFSESSRRSYATRLIVMKECERVLGLLECSDGNVRIGAVAAVRWMRCRPTNDGQKQRLSMSLAEMAACPDPLVRGAAVVIGARMWGFFDGKPRAALARELRQAATDRAPEVRFAAAYLGRRPRWPLPDEELQGLRRDPHAAVRAIAWFGPSLYGDIREPDLSTVSAGLRDANPIVRTACLDHMARLLHSNYAFSSRAIQGTRRAAAANIFRDDPAKLRAAIAAEGLENDAWLKVAAEALLARSAAIRYTRLRARSFNWVEEKEEIFPNVVEGEQEAHATLAGLLNSGKRSHAMLACAMLMQSWSEIRSEPAPFPAGAAQAESPHLPTRLVAAVACGVAEPEANAARLLKALGSADELERLAALRGCRLAQPLSAAAALQEPLTALLRGGRRYESILAAQALAVTLPFEKVLALLQDEGRRPGSASAREILTAASDYRFRSEIRIMGWTSRNGMGYYPPTAHPNQMLLLDVVLDSHDASLQALFLNKFKSSLKNNAPLLLMFIIESELEPFCELVVWHRELLSDPRGVDIPPKGFAREAVLKRLEELLSSPDGRLHPSVVSAVASFFARGSPARPFPAAKARELLELTAPRLASCFRPDATDEEVASACALLDCVLSDVCRERERGEQEQPCLNWQDLPPGMREAFRAGLSYVNHEVHGRKAANLLVSCLRRLDGLEDDPEMLEAVSRARAAIMETGTPGGQAALLSYVTCAEDEPQSEQAATELQKRLLAGRVPAGWRSTSAYSALSRRQERLTPEFIEFLFEGINDMNQLRQGRRDMLSLLSRRPEVYDRLFTEVGSLVDAERLESAGGVVWSLKSELERLSKEKLPKPSWAKGAGELALRIARSPTEGPWGYGSDEEKAIELYVLAAGKGAGAAAPLEALALDDTANPYGRAAAAWAAIEANPGTTLLVTLSENYAKLPPEMREKLALNAARATETPGAEAFFLSCLRDLNIGQYRMLALNALKLPLTPTLMAALKELETDPILGYQVKKKIERLQNPKK